MKNKDKIIIFDGRQMAKKIYEQSIDNITHANFYRQYFPDFAQDIDNYEYYGKMPSTCAKFYSDKSILKIIENHFKKNNICVLHGLSGSGKTQTSIDFFHYKKEYFKNYIWISGDDWRKDTSLCSIRRTRGGVPINITGLFNKEKTILIIDNLNRLVAEEDFKDLNKGFDLGGVVLITSQLSSLKKDLYLQMPEFSRIVAFNILDEKNFEDETINRVIDKCRNFPIILSTARDMIKELGECKYRMKVYNGILRSGNDAVEIIKDILKNLDDDYINYLTLISNTGFTTFDESFLIEFTSINFYINLKKSSIIMNTNTKGIVKIHDLICSALKKHDDKTEILKKFNKYIDDTKGNMTYSVLRQTYFLRETISEYKNTNEELDWLTYALFQTEGDKSLEFAEHMSEKMDLDDFSARAIAKSYIKSESYLKAIEVIEKISFEDRSHWLLYHQAESEMLLGKKSSVDTAKYAYELLKKDKLYSNIKRNYEQLIRRCENINL